MIDLEQKYPRIAQIVELRERKGRDYNSSVSLHDYFPFGQESYTQMIHVKALRLLSLTKLEQPEFESIEDTLMDLVNYALFNLEALDEGLLDDEELS